MEEKFYKVWITLIKGLGIKRYIELVNVFKTNKGIYDANRHELSQVKLIDEKICNEILDVNKRREVKSHLKYMTQNCIDIIFIGDKEYPRNLLNIYSSPIALYIKGKKDILNEKSISVVGCRDCTKYGEIVSKKISYKLALKEINIISGLAKGIDTHSHIGALMAKGKTVAILGNGLDMIYPTENTKLANYIIENNGAIISEFPLGTKPEKMNFPLRNRIISGLSNGVVVVEAKQRSGTLITVDFALEQGKNVFVVPGNITSINSSGTNELIKQGAKIITSTEDILEEL